MMIVSAILTEQNMNDPVILENLQQDMKALIDYEHVQFSLEQRQQYQEMAKQEMLKSMD